MVARGLSEIKRGLGARGGRLRVGWSIIRRLGMAECVRVTESVGELGDER